MQNSIVKYQFIVTLLFYAVTIGAQVKKPHIIVVPSDALLNEMGLLNTTDDMGTENYVEDYKHAFLDTDLKGCIQKISEMFNDRGFPIELLESHLRRAQGRSLIVPVDIRLELNYKIEKQGPRDLLYFELSGIDNYSAKQIAGASGESAPAIGATKVSLLQEAVMDKMDKLAQDLQDYFEKLSIKGRESRLTVNTNDGISLDEEIGGTTISEIVEEWLQNNCMNSSFSVDNQDESIMQVSQSMMPLLGVNGNGLDAYNFYRGLRTVLNNALSTKGYKVSLKRSSDMSGSEGGTLGDAFLVISYQ